MATIPTASIWDRLMVRLDNLEDENRRLKDRVSALETYGRQAAKDDLPLGTVPAATSCKRTNRREMLRSAMGAAAATVTVGALLQTQTGTAHADGVEGPTTFCSHTASLPAVTARGSQGASGLKTVSDDGFGVEASSTKAPYAAVSASGTAGAGGVVARSDNADGVLGLSAAGNGVHGSSSTAAGVYGDTSGSSCGVHGQALGSGDGVLAEALGSGNGLHAVAGGATRLIPGPTSAVLAEAGSVPGVTAVSIESTGVVGTSTNGYGAVFGGAAAPLRLMPSSTPTHPPSGQAGDLFVDDGNSLWYCKGGTAWKQLA